MLNLLLFILIIPFSTTNCQSEDLVTLSIDQLVVASDKVVVARLINVESDQFIFLTRSIVSDHDDLLDTLMLKRHENRLSDFSTVRNSTELILFLKEYKERYRVVTSGYRVFSGENIYMPYQIQWGEGYSFIEIDKQVQWSELIKKVQYVQQKIDTLFALKNIENDTLRNELLFAWMRQHEATFDDKCSLNDTCQWGFLQHEVLKWVSESGIMEDSWKAGLLHKKLFNKNLGEHGKPSFGTEQGRSFLLEVITNPNNSEAERRLALAFLGSPYNVWLHLRERENNPPLSVVGVEEQERILEALKPLLKNDTLKNATFSTIKNLSHPYTHNLKDRTNLILLPYIIDRYKAEKPSEFKDALAKFIFRHIEIKEWKKLAGNKVDIIATLYSNHYDSTKQILHCSISYRNRRYGGYEINVLPKIKMQYIKNGKVRYEKEVEATSDYYPLPFQSNSSRRFKIDVSELEKGTWSFYAFVDTEDSDGIYWKSESEIFVKN